jgi:hypothetical protein
MCLNQGWHLMHNAPKEWIYDSTKDGIWHHQNRKVPKERFLKNEFPMAHGPTISIRVLIFRNPTLNAPPLIFKWITAVHLWKQNSVGLLKPGKDREGGCSCDSGPVLGICLALHRALVSRTALFWILTLDTSAWAIEVVHRHDVPRT